jgi:1A family penicillin-binding protein
MSVTSIKATKNGFVKTLARVIAVLSIIAITTGILTAAATYAFFARDLQNTDALLNKHNTGLVLLDYSGKPFFTFYGVKTMTYVEYGNISKNVIDALISAEDKDYYEHPGFSLKGIARAAYRNFRAQSYIEGGSTIPQTLIKNSLLTPDKSLIRKFKEVVLAVELDRKYDKNKIIEMYLNSAYFGEGAFGINDASKIYFNKEPADLTLAESAILIAVLPAPSKLSPIANDSKSALARQHTILLSMLEDKKITQEQYDAAMREEVIYSGKSFDLNNEAPHFAIYVKDYLLKEFGEEKILRSGFRVKTTLNLNMQRLAEKVVADQVQRLEVNKASNGAVVVMEPQTGYIKAMVGSHNWYDDTNGKINMATEPRSPGSSFKPIVYAAAIEQKVVTAATILNDAPKRYPDGYAPKNYDEKFRGYVTVRRALANSLNVPAVQLVEKLGVKNSVDAGINFGISTLSVDDPSKYGLSIGLGSAEIPLIDMTSAYAVLANKGNYQQPTPILDIEDKFGQKIAFKKYEPKKVISEQASFIISSILSDNQTRAEIFGNALTLPNKTAAVKTGTSEYYRDALTIGYTPSLVIGVWVGNNDNKPMDKIAGSLGAAPIWKTLMTEYLRGKPNERFVVPAGIVRDKVCFEIENKKEEGSDDDDEDNHEDNDKKLVSYEEYYIEGTQKTGCNTELLQAFETTKSKKNNKKDD